MEGSGYSKYKQEEAVAPFQKAAIRTGRCSTQTPHGTASKRVPQLHTGLP